MMAAPSPHKIAVVGSGLIGQSWSMVFAGGGHQVMIFDIYPEQVSKALDNIRTNLANFEADGCLRGDLKADQQAQLITGSSSLEECLSGAYYVQECVPESLELKRKVFEDLDKLVTDDMVVASSSSCIPVSKFAGNMAHRQQTLVAHPVNPPYFIPLVEIVPAPWTRPDIVAKARALLESVGQSPVTLSKESAGFALNRVQYAIINECWGMYKDGLLSAGDIDKLMKDGLGPRYAFIGPMETMHLNADGIVDYCQRYAQGAYDVGKTLTPPPVMYDVPTAEKVLKEMEQVIPPEEFASRRKWRDKRLAALASLKKNLKEKAD